MLIGVKFCGGCNPRYDRGKALEVIKKQMSDKAEFVFAKEGKEYDSLLVIGGCTNCCATYCQYNTKNEVVLMWDENHMEDVIKKMGGIASGLEGNI